MSVSNVVDDILIDVANSDVSDALKDCIIKRHVNGTYNPVTGVETGGLSAEYDCKIILGESPTDNQYKDLGVAFTSNDREAHVFKNEDDFVQVFTNDLIVVGSDYYDIVFSTDSSAGTKKVFKVVLRSTVV